MLNEPKLPVIETERLRLRGHRPGDLANCSRMWADPAATRYIGGRPFAKEEVWARMLRYAGHWSWFGFGYWLIEEKNTSQFVGEVGLADHKRELQPSIQGIPELGWALTHPMSGKGFATESARAAIEWFETNHQPVFTVCLIAPDNIASVGVAAKCRYHETLRTTYHGSPVILFERQATR